MKKGGFLVISLDFELLWGIFDVVDYKEKTSYFNNTIAVIPEILELFRKYEIHCTWATVGMLFLQNWDQWEERKPNNLPSYTNGKLSSYGFAEINKPNIPKKFCFAPTLLKEVLKYPHQEIATHSYSHFYCMEEGQNLNQFEADLQQAIFIGKEFGVVIKSLVFPRNQINRDYLRICKKMGINSVRSNPDSWYWKDPSSNSLLTKIFRTGDAYNFMGASKSYAIQDLKISKDFPLIQKASRFLRPLEEQKEMRTIKIKRIKKEILHAARKGEIFHLWWHPHNFGNFPNQSLQDLEEILKYYQNCKIHYGFESANMDELFHIFNSQEI